MHLMVWSFAIFTKIWSFLFRQNFVKNSLILITTRHLFCIVFTYFIWRSLSINFFHSFLAVTYSLFKFVINLEYRLIFCLQFFHIYLSKLKLRLKNNHFMIWIWCWRSHKRDFFDLWMLTLFCIKIEQWPNVLKDLYHGPSHGFKIWLM